MSKFNIKIWLPLVLMIIMAFGVYVGSLMNIGDAPGKLFSIKYTERDKLYDVINYITSDYVDKVNRKELTEKTIDELLTHLDPHSSYIPTRDLESVEESMAGNFYGIGVQFRQWHDSVVVIIPMEGGPSKKAGIHAGDRIITADEISLVGINNDSIMKLLKGPGGSKVELIIYRPSKDSLLNFTIRRGSIPYKSLVSNYTIDDSIAYIKIDRFAATSYNEFKKALYEMNLPKIKFVIVDLQNNGGGLFSTAISLTDEFLPEGRVIVYTKGRMREKEISYSTSNQLLKGKGILVLVDENSASASEIFSGAMQDNDAGTVIGRRTFGKGLVQEQVNLADNSAIRLTVARYYTASGRCIQKPYNRGTDEYYHEIMKRYTSGEMYNADSASFPDSLKFRTLSGKIVYGGGGIWPDVFVPVDTSVNYWFFNQLQRNGVLPDFVFNYFDKNRISLMKNYPTEDDFIKGFVVSNKMITSLFAKAKEANSVMSKTMDPKMINEIKLSIKAQLASDLYGSNAYYKVINPQNEIYISALKYIKDFEKSTH